MLIVMLMEREREPTRVVGGRYDTSLGGLIVSDARFPPLLDTLTEVQPSRRGHDIAAISQMR